MKRFHPVYSRKRFLQQQQRQPAKTMLRRTLAVAALAVLFVLCMIPIRRAPVAGDLRSQDQGAVRIGEPKARGHAHATASSASSVEAAAGTCSAVDRAGDVSAADFRTHSVTVHRAVPGSLQYNHMAMLEQLPNASLALAWQASSGIEGVADQHIVLSVSNDESGKTWGPPQKIPLRNEGPVWSPVLTFDERRNALILFYAESSDCVIHKHGAKRWSPGGDVKMVEWRLGSGANSGDFVSAWSEPQMVYRMRDGDGLPKVLANKMIRLRSGEWVLPMWSEKHGDGVCASSKEKGSAGVLVSADEGRTWEKRGTLTAPDTWLIENTVVEREDASLLMLFRTKKGYIYSATSVDKGRSWSPARPTRVKNPDSKIHALHLGGNGAGAVGEPSALALAYNGHKKLVKPSVRGGRTNLEIALSADEGASWRKIVRVEEEIDVGLRSHYPTLLFDRSACRLFLAYTKFYHESQQAKSKWNLFDAANKNPQGAPLLGVFVTTLDFKRS